MSRQLYIKYINHIGSTESLPVGLALKMMRKSNKMTIKSTSLKLKIHRNTLINYERNITKVPYRIFVKCVKLYGVKIVEIFFKSN